MKFDTGDTVTEIYHRGARILLDHTRAIFERFKNDRARRISEWPVFLCREIKIKALAVFLLVESFYAGIEHCLHIRGDRPIFLFQLRDRFLDANCVPDFEWPEFPIEPPAHRAIDFDDRVRDLRNSFG